MAELIERFERFVELFGVAAGGFWIVPMLLSFVGAFLRKEKSKKLDDVCIIFFVTWFALMLLAIILFLLLSMLRSINLPI